MFSLHNPKSVRTTWPWKSNCLVLLCDEVIKPHAAAYFLVKEEVFRFEISVDDAEWVKVAQSTADLCYVELGPGLLETPLSLQVEEQLG